MSRLRDALIRPIVFVIAILTIQTIDVMSWPAKARQAPGEGKSEAANTEKLLADSDCRSCHAADRKVAGPSYIHIARRYAAQAHAVDKLARIIRQGGSGEWGNVSMTPHPYLKDEQLAQIVAWILSLKDAQPAPTQPEQAAAKQYKYTLNDGKTVALDFQVFVEGSDKKVAKDIFHGYQLYNSYCYRCHGTDATTSELAPDLRRFTEAGTTPQDFLSVAMVCRKNKGMQNWDGFLNQEDNTP